MINLGSPLEEGDREECGKRKANEKESVYCEECRRREIIEEGKEEDEIVTGIEQHEGEGHDQLASHINEIKIGSDSNDNNSNHLNQETSLNLNNQQNHLRSHNFDKSIDECTSGNLSQSFDSKLKKNRKNRISNLNRQSSAPESFLKNSQSEESSENTRFLSSQNSLVSYTKNIIKKMCDLRF